MSYFTSAVLGDCSREGHGGPIGRGRRYELIASVREVAVEVRLNRQSASSHVPRAVRELSIHQKLDTALIRRIASSDKPRFAQRNKCLASRIGVAVEVRELCPASIRTLHIQ